MYVSVRKLPAKGRQMALASKGGSTAGSYGWQIYLRRRTGDNKIVLVFRASVDGGNTYDEIVTAPVTISTNTFYHIVYRLDTDHSNAAQVRGFLNGSRVANGSFINDSGHRATINNPDLPLYLGRDASSSAYFDGVIDEVCIHNTTGKYPGTGFPVQVSPCQPQ